MNSDMIASRECSSEENSISKIEREVGRLTQEEHNLQVETNKNHNSFSNISCNVENENQISNSQEILEKSDSGTPHVTTSRFLSEELSTSRIEREAPEALGANLPKQQEFQNVENRLRRIEGMLGITGELATLNENSRKRLQSMHSSFYNPRSNISDSRFIDISDPLLNQEDQTTIPKDTYSFIYLCSLRTNPFGFLFGLIVFFFQMGLLMALILPVLYQHLDTHGAIENDKSIFPADVDFIVKISQWLAMMAFVIFANESMEDLLTAVSMLPTKLTTEADENIVGLILSSLLRLTQGACAVFATFLLIFTSVTSRDVVLNFAAVNFISRLDEIGFTLATKGFYVFKSFRRAAFQIQVKELPSCITAKRYPHIQSIAVLIIFISTMVASVYVFANQINGNYLDQRSFRINFSGGSLISEKLQSFYGGCYSYDPNTFSLHRRFILSEKLIYNHTDVSMFRYCDDERRWDLFEGNYSDACTEEGLLAYSTETTSFEIQHSFADPWFSKEGIPLDISFRTDGITAKNCQAKSKDGKCDIVLNTEGFGWDRGDCCGATCDHPDCALHNNITKAFDTPLSVPGNGFPYCEDTNMVPITIRIENITEKRIPKDSIPENHDKIASFDDILRREALFNG